MQRPSVPFCPPSPLSPTFTSLCTMPRSWRYTGDKIELSEPGCPLPAPYPLPPSGGVEPPLTQHQHQLGCKQADGGLGEAPSGTPQRVQVPSAAVGAHCQDGSHHPYPGPRRHQSDAWGHMGGEVVQGLGSSGHQSRVSTGRLQALCPGWYRHQGCTDSAATWTQRWHKHCKCMGMKATQTSQTHRYESGMRIVATWA